MSIAIDIIRRLLDAESKRINGTASGFGVYPKTNAVTESLNMLLCEVALKESRIAVKPIVDAEIDAENRTRAFKP